VIDAAARCGGRAASSTAATAEHEKVHTIAGVQERRIRAAGGSLVTLDVPAEQVLIKLVRPVRIRSEDRAATPAAKRHQSFLR
jgi:hypothetical protein